MESDPCLKFGKYIYAIVHKLETERKISVELAPETKKLVKMNLAKLLSENKGILLFDPQPSSFAMLLDHLYQFDTNENRNRYRELFLTTPNINEFISGVVLNDEGLEHKTKNGKLCRTMLQNEGIMIGARLDFPSYPLGEGDFEENILLLGLDNINTRFEFYKEKGCQFLKVTYNILIDKERPGFRAIDRNAMMLSIFSTMCHENHIVPIVVITYDRNGDYDLKFCGNKLLSVLGILQHSFIHHRVFMEGVIFGIDIFGEGNKCKTVTSPQERAIYTFKLLIRSLSPRLGGMVLITEHETPIDATEMLNAVSNPDLIKPWHTSFLFGRALLESPGLVWSGWDPKVDIAQAEFLNCAKHNCLALAGKFFYRVVPDIKFIRPCRCSKHEFYV
ncbi:fructose-bisphosphate aldolase-like [Teleopsis dalmanni]|uniref:fructose-bisphosphate aldolase-like n=1 Tax=Teleopsis dalmanni TaxID=139649 RepID=UPI0018CF5C55|nr:fructose-bisphosphate aldolase-like [Teleopsis dalmanni]